ncbi:MAG: hypothetical protein PUK41_07750 [Campylobacter hominis]|uniref:hypothetical protein n=1 Tax=Campylobacter TaxID=194 RepID=UPI0023F2AD65|nr:MULTISPECIES: hypothetical protein [Campylobacter]MCI6641288.1 hypothetical protein [Campylobacter sp.]MDD7423227.1 hypothetical protein [Campylobacter hominis]
MKILKITLVSLLLITIFCALFLRIIPNYSNKYGFEIVTLNDYKKYKQGYCLKENRILSKDEIYRRAVKSYLLTIREEAEYPKYYNYMDEKYEEWDICVSDRCSFYKFDVKNLDELNKLIISAGKIYVLDFLRKYGKKFELNYNIILDKNENFINTLVFDNVKSTRIEIYFPNTFSIIEQNEMRDNKTLMDQNKKAKFPSSSEYSRYYLKIKYFYENMHSGDIINLFATNDIYYYIPITICGEIKLSDIFDEPGGRKYIFGSSENEFDR